MNIIALSNSLPPDDGSAPVWLAVLIFGCLALSLYIR